MGIIHFVELRPRIYDDFSNVLNLYYNYRWVFFQHWLIGWPWGVDVACCRAISLSNASCDRVPTLYTWVWVNEGGTGEGKVPSLCLQCFRWWWRRVKMIDWLIVWLPTTWETWMTRSLIFWKEIRVTANWSFFRANSLKTYMLRTMDVLHLQLLLHLTSNCLMFTVSAKFLSSRVNCIWS